MEETLRKYFYDLSNEVLLQEYDFVNANMVDDMPRDMVNQLDLKRKAIKSEILRRMRVAG